MLELDEVTVQYGQVLAVDSASLKMDDKKSTILALLGPSGCGKSTLLRAIAGLEHLESGRVSFADQDLSPVPAHRRNFGLMFQDGQLFPHLTVAGNIAFGLRMAKWGKTKTKARVDELLDLVDLAGIGSRRTTELSGGQAQRVALARALAPRPKLLLLDEPLSALDRQLRDKLAEDIRMIVKATQTPALVVTHDHNEAIAMADSFAVMESGAIKQQGSALSLWRRPADSDIAQFLGFTIQFDSIVQSRYAQTPFGVLPIDLKDGPVRIGIRPEAIEVYRLTDGSREVSESLIVTREVMVGPTRMKVRITVADIGEVEASLLSSDAHSDFRISERLPEPGELLRAIVRPWGIAAIGVQ
ncbi:MAG: ABC transporter ATP-binding protein [Mycobacteriaceae bacterium]